MYDIIYFKREIWKKINFVTVINTVTKLPRNIYVLCITLTRIFSPEYNLNFSS